MRMSFLLASLLTGDFVLYHSKSIGNFCHIIFWALKNKGKVENMLDFLRSPAAWQLTLKMKKKCINYLNMMLLQNIAVVNVLWNPVVMAKMVISF